MSKKKPIKINTISKEEGLDCIRKMSEYPNQLGIIVPSIYLDQLNNLNENNNLEDNQAIIHNIISEHAIPRKNTRAEMALEKITMAKKDIENKKEAIRNNQLTQADHTQNTQVKKKSKSQEKENKKTNYKL